MEKYISQIIPKAEYVSPSALTKPPTSLVEQPNDLARTIPFSIAPKHYIDAFDEYDTTLPPTPRNNVDNDPACTNCTKYKDPFHRGDCMMLFSPDQNMWGEVCGNKNVDVIRGNQFGTGYEPERLWGKKMYEETPPVVRKRNPDVVVPTSDYPTLDYFYTAFDQYKGYPFVRKEDCGLPEYTFPYNIMNEKQGLLQKIINPFRNDSIENFHIHDNPMPLPYHSVWTLLAILIIGAFILCMARLVFPQYRSGGWLVAVAIMSFIIGYTVVMHKRWM